MPVISSKSGLSLPPLKKSAYTKRSFSKVRFRPLINAKPDGETFMLCAFERGREVFSRGGGLPEKLRRAVLPRRCQVAQSDEPFLLLKPNAEHLDKHFDAPAVLAEVSHLIPNGEQLVGNGVVRRPAFAATQHFDELRPLSIARVGW